VRGRPGSSLSGALIAVGVPALLAMVIVGVAFAEITGPLSYLWRPLAVAGAAGAIIGLVAFIVFGHWGTMLAASVVLILLRPTDWPALLPLAALLLIGAWFHRRGRRPGWLAPRALASGVGIVLVLVAGMTGVRIARAAIHIGFPPQPTTAASAATTNIYLVLLDAYGRPDTLRSLGIEIDPFLDELGGLGFDVYEDATSRFAWTPQTLAALFSGTNDGVPGRVSERAGQRRLLRAIEHGALIERASASGYELVVIDPPVPHVTFTVGEHHSHPSINAFEATLIGRSPLATLVGSDVLVDQLRTRLDDDMRLLEALSEQDGRIVLAHFMVPHPPFLYRLDGSEMPGPECWPRCDLFDTHMELMPMDRAEYVAGLAGNLAAVNDRMLRVFEVIIERDPEAIVVLFGDHGTRMSVHDKEEWRHPFLAARTPGRPELFGTAPDPGGTLREILDAYAAE
jgi:hypothetical protein